MPRLTAGTLPHVARGVRVPGYDRLALRPGLVHLGVGAFHRCHQGEFTEDAIEAGAEDRGVTGINLAPPLLGPDLGEQDGLYSRTLREGERADMRVIGCLRRVIDASVEPAAALAAVADRAVDVVTMTITEKGYCHVPATGELDEAHPGIAADLAHPDAPRTAIGFLVAALARRRAHGRGVTLVSCDNIPSNGVVLRGVVTALARHRDPALARWIESEIRFPSTMVDRIVPATTQADRGAAAAALGLEDRACVVGEPFRQWVLEDDFVGRRPRWDAAGAAFVADVKPYELVKMRVLNAAQTTASLVGLLLGLTTSHEAIAHPALRRFVGRFLDEAVAELPHPPGMERDAYRAEALLRIGNTAIRHRCTQIATDSSRKIIQRVLDPLRETLAAGRPIACLAASAGAFVAVRARATAAFGAMWQIDDPIAETAEAAAGTSGGDPAAFFTAIAGMAGIFGDLAGSAAFLDATSAHVVGWLADPHVHLQRLAGGN